MILDFFSKRHISFFFQCESFFEDVIPEGDARGFFSVLFIYLRGLLNLFAVYTKDWVTLFVMLW